MGKRRPLQGDKSGLTRRAAIGRMAAFVGGLALDPVRAVQLPPELFVPMHEQGQPLSGYGERSPFEKAARAVRRIRNNPTNGISLTPLADLHGILTPSALHFERHHAGVPTLHPASYRLLLHGLVKRPLLLTLDDLRRFPSVSAIRFIECSGNGVNGYRGTDPSLTAQQIDGLVSTSEWTGVLLSTLLREAGVDPRARWVVAEGFDAAAMTRSIPLEKGLGGRARCLRPERGGAAASPGISGPPRRSRLGGEHQRQVAAAPRGNGYARHEPGRDCQVHGPAAGRNGASVHLAHPRNNTRNNTMREDASFTL